MAISYGLAHHGIFESPVLIREEIGTRMRNAWNSEARWFSELLNDLIPHEYRDDAVKYFEFVETNYSGLGTLEIAMVSLIVKYITQCEPHQM